ncbi:MAG: stalled ribosome rescue protein Dom34 [Polaribacter sp.]|jgi:stalled ribosome rescue protein Dom34
MKNIGIWLDKEKANIVSLENGKETIETIISDVENFRIHGGSGTRLKGGPQDVVQDSKYLEREKHQLKSYFKNIATEIKDADAIVIFGPAEAYEKFYKELKENYHPLSVKVKDARTADSMTENQTIALVRDFFK